MSKQEDTFQPTQQGQSLALVAIAAVVLIAFVGLAVDGGNAFAQRRIAQNAADGASVRGALTIVGTWRTLSPTGKRDTMQTRIVEAAELHGIPDTDGAPAPGNNVNTNVIGYYTNEEGTVFETCPVITCTDTAILADAWGVKVVIDMPVETYFAGVIGWNEIGITAEGLGLAQPGAMGSDGSEWSMFALDTQSCNSTGTPALHFQGNGSRLGGNAHSNGNFNLANSNMYLAGTGTISYAGTCVNCPSASSEPKARFNVVSPNFDTYYNFAATHTQAPHTGRFHNGNLLWPGSSGQTTLGSDGMTTPAAPVTFINGDLTIQSNAITEYVLAGLIMVNGNVLIDTPRIRSQSTTAQNGGQTTGAAIMATGVIQVTPRTRLNMTGFKDRRAPAYDPLLSAAIQVVALYSDRDFTQGGGDVCTTPSIDLLANNYAINGAIIAPNGLVNVYTTTVAGTRQIAGTIIGDTLSVNAPSVNVSFRPEWFPPQPDQVELRE